MNFGLAIYSDLDQEQTSLIVNFSDQLKDYFKNKYYGDDVKAYTIGVVCVSPQYEQFFQVKKPRYTKGKKETIQHGIPFTLEDNFEYSIKIDFESFKNADNERAKKILAKEILASLTILDQMKSKIKDFDSTKFKGDLMEYLKEQKLI
jgi:hypothetical protein